MTLFPGLRPVVPVAPAGIGLRCCDVVEVLQEAKGARLVHADPPWQYSQDMGKANPEMNGIYSGLSEADIVAHLSASWACAGPAARLAVWYTWPKAPEWRAAGMAGPQWGAEVSGGAWVKMRPTSEGADRGNVGVGYHWRGKSEPVALFTRGTTGRPNETLLNGYVGPSMAHSEKPLEWLRAWVRAWTDPGDLVLDLYAGLAPMARACFLEGRRYLGAEIDPERHRRALVALQEVVDDRR